MPGKVMTRAEVYRARAEIEAHLRTFRGNAANPMLPWGYRYEVIVMVDVCWETISDLEVMLRLMPEA